MSLGLQVATSMTAALLTLTSPIKPFSEDFSVYTDERTQKPVILDMDFGSDVDDACALRIAANADIIGDISLKAVTMSVYADNELNIRAADGMLDYQGLKNVDYGYTTCGTYDESKYWDTLAQYSDGQYKLDTAVRVWRKVIAQSNRKVDIITTGYLMNLCDFCQSGPDDISDLTGMEMLNDYVGNIYIVGGSWTDGYDNNFYAVDKSKESVDWVLKNVTRPLFFISNEAGGVINVGGMVTREYPDDPLSKALLAFGTDYGRAGWDPFAMYVCVYGDSVEQLESKGLGIMPINFGFDVDTGENHWSEAEESNFYRIYRVSDDLGYYQDLLDRCCLVVER